VTCRAVGYQTVISDLARENGPIVSVVHFGVWRGC